MLLKTWIWVLFELSIVFILLSLPASNFHNESNWFGNFPIDKLVHVCLFGSLSLSILVHFEKSKFTKSFSAKKLTAKTVAKVKSNKYGNISLIANETGKITNFQIESIRRFLRRFLKKKAQIFFRIFPNTPITKKPNDIRLGRGKGNLKY
jgi:ribosomal protein L16